MVESIDIVANYVDCFREKLYCLQSRNIYSVDRNKRGNYNKNTERQGLSISLKIFFAVLMVNRNSNSDSDRVLMV